MRRNTQTQEGQGPQPSDTPNKINGLPARLRLKSLYRGDPKSQGSNQLLRPLPEFPPIPDNCHLFPDGSGGGGGQAPPPSQRRRQWQWRNGYAAWVRASPRRAKRHSVDKRATMHRLSVTTSLAGVPRSMVFDLVALCRLSFQPANFYRTPVTKTRHAQAVSGTYRLGSRPRTMGGLRRFSR